MKPSKRILPVALIAAAAGAAVVTTLSCTHRGNGDLGASGTVEAVDARLGFDVPGRVASVAVHEGDPVQEGRVLAVLDTTQVRARLDEARARARAAKARLVELESGSRSEEVAQARARAQAAADRLRQARKDFDRTRTLFDGGAVSEEDLDRARTALDVAGSDSVQTAEALRQAVTGPRSQTVEAQRAELARAEAAANATASALALMSVRAPFDGVVTVRHREPGETVSPGSPVLTVTNLDDRWIRIYIPETSIGRVRLGQAASISCDSFPGKAYDGRVSFIASEAEFTPKNVQTDEERVKLVYMVKVRVTGDPERDLKPGMPADVVLEETGS